MTFKSVALIQNVDRVVEIQKNALHYVSKHSGMGQVAMHFVITKALFYLGSMYTNFLPLFLSLHY